MVYRTAILSSWPSHWHAQQVRKQFGVKKDLLGLLEGRETFIIGKDGVIKEIYNDQWGPEKHISVALEALAA